MLPGDEGYQEIRHVFSSSSLDIECKTIMRYTQTLPETLNEKLQKKISLQYGFYLPFWQTRTRARSPGALGVHDVVPSSPSLFQTIN
jgi:hypothetical protein